jgi:polysaccharide biosynthesis/export protein
MRLNMRKLLLIWALIAFLCFSPLRSGAQEAAPPQVEREQFTNEYIIGPRDLLEIKVFELPDLNQTVRVSEDGSITLPLLNNVVIGGMSKDAAEIKLTRLLADKFVKNPHVSVFIKEYQSRLVSLIGAIEKPGVYELVGRQNLLQMISKAGGVKENASNRLFVLREGKSGNPAMIAVDLEDLLANGNPILNIPLQAGDVINIPVDKSIRVFVFGEVKSPGALEVKKSKNITLLQAIAQAGGTTEGASKSGITIKRKDPKTGKEKKIKVNLNDILKGKIPDIGLLEGDVVFVPVSIF